MAECETGVVKWFSTGKGCGFITRQQDDDVFVHYTGIRGGGFPFLKEGQLVEFTMVRGKKGRKAVDVVVVLLL